MVSSTGSQDIAVKKEPCRVCRVEQAGLPIGYIRPRQCLIWFCRQWEHLSVAGRQELMPVQLLDV